LRSLCARRLCASSNSGPSMACLRSEVVEREALVEDWLVDSLSLSAGQFETTIAVGGVNVTVSGIVLNGVTRISTAFVP
jgi:hypothetical protein